MSFNRKGMLLATCHFVNCTCIQKCNACKKSYWVPCLAICLQDFPSVLYAVELCFTDTQYIQTPCYYRLLSWSWVVHFPKINLPNINTPFCFQRYGNRVWLYFQLLEKKAKLDCGQVMPIKPGFHFPFSFICFCKILQLFSYFILKFCLIWPWKVCYFDTFFLLPLSSIFGLTCLHFPNGQLI